MLPLRGSCPTPPLCGGAMETSPGLEETRWATEGVEGFSVGGLQPPPAFGHLRCGGESGDSAREGLGTPHTEDIRPLHAGTTSQTGRLERLEAGQAIVYGGDRVAHVSAELAAAFRPGDRL